MLTTHRTRTGLAAAVLASLVLASSATGAGAADEPPGDDAPERPPVMDVECDAAAQATDDVVRSGQPSLPLDQMRVAEVHERYATGAGVGVVVIDSGIGTQTPYLGAVGEGQPQVGPSGDDEPEPPGRPAVPHGTIVAGLIAGDRPGDDDGGGAGMGIAPDAELTSIRIVAGPTDTDDTAIIDEDQFETADLVAGLDWVAREADPRGIRVVNLSLTAPDTPELEAAVRRVQEEDVIVVAATGNRTEQLPTDDTFAPAPQDDPRYPAAYPGVVGVGAFVPRGAGQPAAQFVLGSSVVDVVASTVGAVSTVPTGSACLLLAPATSWSTAYVSGALALLAEAFPEDTPEQLVARLVESASGSPGAPGPYSGAGVIQPLEAMTRDLDPARDGEVERVDREADEGVAQPPPVRADQLADARDDFRWWGLLAGAVLVAAVILRPLLRRARRG